MEVKDQMEKTDKAATAFLSPDEAHQLIGGNKVINRSTFYSAINRGQVPHLRMGKRIIIPRVAFMEWIESAGRVKVPA